MQLIAIESGKAQLNKGILRKNLIFLLCFEKVSVIIFVSQR